MVVQSVHLSQYAEHADALIPLSSSDSDMPSVAARVTLWMNIARLCSEAKSAPDFVTMLRREQALTQGNVADAESTAIPEHVQGDVSASVDAQGQEQAEITEVDVPEMNFLMVDGSGAPESAEYKEAIEALYSVSYTLKFMIKKGDIGIDYGVLPLEGLWWADDMSDFINDNKSNWIWTMIKNNEEKFCNINNEFTDNFFF